MEVKLKSFMSAESFKLLQAPILSSNNLKLNTQQMLHNCCMDFISTEPISLKEGTVHLAGTMAIGQYI